MISIFMAILYCTTKVGGAGRPGGRRITEVITRITEACRFILNGLFTAFFSQGAFSLVFYAYLYRRLVKMGCARIVSGFDGRHGGLAFYLFFFIN